MADRYHDATQQFQTDDLEECQWKETILLGNERRKSRRRYQYRLDSINAMDPQNPFNSRNRLDPDNPAVALDLANHHNPDRRFNRYVR